MRRKKTNTAAIVTAVCFAISFLFTIAVMFVDVAAIGPQGARVGLARMNGAVRDIIGVNEMWYDITKYLGVIAILIAGAFALYGFLQMIRKKSIFRVDYAVIMLGVIYFLTIALYVFFEVVVINVRPVIMAGEDAAQASFPSSHTMLACVIFGTAIPAFMRLSEDRKKRLIVTCACVFFVIVMIAGRLLSGVHWLSDIIAAVFISSALISLYVFLLRFR